MRPPPIRRLSSSAVRREAHADVTNLLTTLGPTGRDDLGLRVEAHALGAVNVGVAQQRLLPATEGVVGDRNRDRHIDTDHAGLDIDDEVAGRVTVGGEDRGAVAKLGGVDDLDGFLVGVGVHDDQDRRPLRSRRSGCDPHRR